MGILLVLLSRNPLPNNLTFAIKTNKIVSLLFTYEKNWSVFGAVKKIIAYYDNIYQKKNERLMLHESAKLCGLRGCVEMWVAWVKNLCGSCGSHGSINILALANKFLALAQILALV